MPAGDIMSTSPEALASIQHGLDDGDFVVFDIETTGGNPEKNGITEIFAIRFHKGEIKETFGTLVNPEIPIPPIVRRMTGINNQMVKGAPKIDAVMPDFIKFAGKSILVSHNTIGDMKFIRYFAKTACNVDFENFFLCTHLLVERLASEAPDKSLKGLAVHFDLAAGELHRAEADAYVTLSLFKVLVEKLKSRSVKKIEEAVRLQGDMESGLRLGWGVQEGRLSRVPEGPGVYRLYDHEKKVTFLSCTADLRREMAKLKSLDQLPKPLIRLALRSYDIEWQATANVYEAMLLESQQLKDHHVSFVPSQWHQKIMQTLYMTHHADGSYRVGIGPLPKGTKAAFGPVRDRRIVGEYLDQLLPFLSGQMGKQEMHLDAFAATMLVDLLAGDLAKKYEQEKTRLKSLKMLFKPTERRLLKETVEKMSGLLKVRAPQRIQNILALTGLVVVRGEKAGNYHVHVVVNSLPRKMLVVRGDVEAKIRDVEGSREFLDVIRQFEGEPRSEILSDLEVYQANATLWWIYNGRFEGRFVPLAEIGLPAGEGS